MKTSLVHVYNMAAEIATSLTRGFFAGKLLAMTEVEEMVLGGV